MASIPYNQHGQLPAYPGQYPAYPGQPGQFVQPGEPVQYGQPMVASSSRGQMQTTTCENLAATPMKALGGLQVAFGILCILFTATNIAVADAVLGTGILVAIMFMLSGSFGVLAGKTKLQCQIVTCLVLSVISAILGFQFLISCVAVMIYNRMTLAGPMALTAILLVLSLAEVIISICQSSLCCRVVCCGARMDRAAPMQYVEAGPGGHGPVQYQIATSPPAGYPA